MASLSFRCRDQKDFVFFVLHHGPQFTRAFVIFAGVCFLHFIGVASALSSRVPAHLDSTNNRNLGSLCEWASENGISFAGNVGFSSTGENDDDWEISRIDKHKVPHLKEGSVVLSVPKTMVLASSDVYEEMGGSTVLEHAFQKLEQEGMSDHKAEFLLFLKILKEVEKGEDSKWHTWIQSLPKTFSTGVCFDDTELECLPSFSRVLADYERAKVQAFGFAATMIPQSWATSNKVTKDEYDNLFQWAFNVVYTRCWKFSDELDSETSEIVPIGDLFNHKEPANIAVENVPHSKTIDFVLQAEHSDGEVGFSLSYGLTNPYRFLVIFGFVDESMPDIFCQVIFPTPSPDHIALGCEDRSKMVYRTKDGAISDTIWDAILYSLLMAKPDEQKALVNAHIKGDSSTKEILRKKYALEAALTLRNHVSATLRELESLDTKIEKAKVDDASHHCLQLIEKHNSFLKGVFQKVNQRLVALIETETRKRRAEKKDRYSSS